MSVIKTDGAIYSKNNGYYGELVHFDHIDCSGESRVLNCSVESKESLNRIKELIAPSELVCEEKDGKIMMLFDENKYDIKNIQRLISFYSGQLGAYTIKEMMAK